MARKDENLVYVLAGLAGLFWLLSNKTLSVPGMAWKKLDVENLAARIISENGFNVAKEMATAIAQVESSFNPLALRYESHINDVSGGLMQTLLSTARWLATDMGYGRYGVPGIDDLMDPETSMYFGLAYLNYLRNYRGQLRDYEWIVRSYNGGPGADNPQTQAYFEKYMSALTEGVA